MNSAAVGRLKRLVLACWLTGMVGCASLPRIVPDMALPREASVQVADAGGPLSPERSKAVLDALKSRKQDSNIFDRHLALEEAIVGSPLVAGNKVRLLQDGAATFDAMLAAIGDARDHINLETYIIESDEVGHLLRRCAAGQAAPGRTGEPHLRQRRRLSRA